MILPALLCLAPLAPRQDAESERAELTKLQPEINAAIDFGVSYLLEEQLDDGSWDHLPELYPTGATALCALALMKSGLEHDHPAVSAALRSFLSRRPDETYSAGVQLMALEATRAEQHLAAMEPILELLLDWNERGGWSYPGGHGGDIASPVVGTRDLSNIQYAVLGLLAAQRAEYEVKERVWKGIAGEALDYQAKSGGFRYWSEEHSPFPVTGSMTSAGIAILHAAREALGKKAPARVDDSIEEGLAWLEQNLSFVKNPSDRDGTGGELFQHSGGHFFYYLFGLERVGAFLDRTHLGGKNWYLEGARRIVKRQANDGSWNDPPTTVEIRTLTAREESSTLSDTCFALLFLRRASARTGADAVAPDNYVSEDGSDQVRLRGSSRAGGLTVWIDGFHERVVEHWGSGDVVRGLRVAKVAYLVDGEVVVTVEGDPLRGWAEDHRYSRKLWLTLGEHEISVRVELVEPDAPRGARDATVQIKGAGFTVDPQHATRTFDPLLSGLGALRKDEEVRSIEASSNGDHARRAADRIFATRWLSAPGDENPTLELELKKAVEVSAILLCQAARRPDEERRFDSIRKLELRVDGDKEPRIVEVTGSNREPLRIELGEPRRVRKLELRVLEREAGPKSDGSLGFSEIAFL